MAYYNEAENRAKGRIFYNAKALGLDVSKSHGTWTLIDPETPALLLYNVSTNEADSYLDAMRRERRTKDYRLTAA